MQQLSQLVRRLSFRRIGGDLFRTRSIGKDVAFQHLAELPHILGILGSEVSSRLSDKVRCDRNGDDSKR
jgi:hypothetical protein